MIACDGWTLDDPERPDQRRPLTRDEWAEHQAGCEKCRDPWFASPKED